MINEEIEITQQLAFLKEAKKLNPDLGQLEIKLKSLKKEYDKTEKEDINKLEQLNNIKYQLSELIKANKIHINNFLEKIQVIYMTVGNNKETLKINIKYIERIDEFNYLRTDDLIALTNKHYILKYYKDIFENSEFKDLMLTDIMINYLKNTPNKILEGKKTPLVI